VAVAPNDVWSVGFGADAISGGNLTLTEHWDGTNWLVVSSPNAGSSSRLRGVAAVAADDVWAVESYSTNGSGSPQTLIEHYALCPASTATPTVTTTPPTATATRTNTPSSTATAPPSNTATGTPSRTVTTTPTNTVLPTVTPTVTITPTLAATATSTMTASATATVNNTTTRTVTAMPTITPTPTRTVTGTATPVASSTPTGTAMAAHTITATNTLTRSPAITGTATNPPIVTATVAPTQTAPALSTATATVLPASATALPATATASATACVLPFSDVPPSYYAYGYITWLYCRGAITGYSDGTFRPEATVTRGQTAKIVLLGAGLGVQIPAGAPHFSDVLPSNVFYGFVETAFGRGIVTGYSDGTFRPSAAVTRGQIAKIVVGARGLSLLSPPSPTFADVAATDVFYPFVETAAAHGIVGGYTCGGTGEPCDGGHRPYYRPGANATRAQLSKLVYLAFVGP